MIPEKPGLKACVLSKSFENTISERLRQYEIALSILAEYPQGLERFKVAIKQDSEAGYQPASDTDAAHQTTSREHYNVSKVGS